MAMLAERRQRKRYNLTPRGKALYEDDARFGTKMLEKMGWSKGKGLGANEDGSQDFVRVRMRNTNEGLGYEDRDDHWTQHEQDFNGLLKSLNGDEGDKEKATEDKESASDEDTPRVGFGFAPEPKKPKVEKLKDKISGVSLEQKSKLSKARVHYQKFTKGKDIAQYSEKDLANIFGKKVVETETADGVYAQLTAIMTKEDNEKSETAESKEIEVKPNFAGVQTISTGLSVSDYFKQKMEALKNKQSQNIGNTNEVANEEVSEVQEEEPTPNKKKFKKRKHERDANETVHQSSEANAFTQVAENTSLEVQEKKEKKTKKNKNTENTENVIIENDKPLNENHCEEIDNLPTSKKDKKKEADSTIATVVITDEVDIEDDEVPKKKKKKKSKENTKELCTNQKEVIVDKNTAEEISVSEAPKKKKKSKKSKRKQSREDDVIIVSVEAPTYVKSLVVAEQSKCPTEVGLTSDINVKKNKKSKKKKNGGKTGQASETKVSVDVTAKPKKSKKDVSEDKQPLTLDELIAKCNSFNIYTISSFVAEKFRNVDLDSFKGSTITHIPGYTQTEDCQLKIKNEPKDEERITRLWNCSENKYVELNPKAIYGRYKRNILNAYTNKRRAKKPLPLFNIKSLKRKSVFQPI